MLDDLKSFVETHPDDVVLIVIQDATTPEDTAQAFVDAGLEDKIATLQLGQPLPTLQELIDAGTTLVVFAEDGGATSGPAWYQPAYEGWMQETPFSFDSSEAFDCATNRGGGVGELFLVNHWVTTKGPDPGLARRANSDDIVRRRLERCVRERGAMVNIIATDFTQASDVVELVEVLNTELLDEVPDGGDEPDAPATTTPPASTVTTTTEPSTSTTIDAADLEEPTVISTLTGGDPGRFCATVDDALAAATVYSEAVLSEPAADVGRSDLAFAPLLIQALTPFLDTAPVELFERADPLRQRAEAATATLTELGLDDATQARLAEQAAQAVNGTTPTDGATLQADLLATIAEIASEEDIEAAVAALTESGGDPAPQLDLGYVSPEVARDSGYTCE